MANDNSATDPANGTAKRHKAPHRPKGQILRSMIEDAREYAAGIGSEIAVHLEMARNDLDSALASGWMPVSESSKHSRQARTWDVGSTVRFKHGLDLAMGLDAGSSATVVKAENGKHVLRLSDGTRVVNVSGAALEA